MPKVLLSEDEEFVARSYIRKLQVEGFEVVHAHNGEEALKLMLLEKPDLVILDLMMPLKTGFEVLQELKGNEYKEVHKIPVIVASNLGQKSDIDTALSLGAVDFLVKSNISLKELVAKVREHIPSK
jgi:two-component system, OmpR family, alkaline phosphatase synthesis response regulator PhoP